MDVPVVGGPFHGATLDVPRRTPAGLLVALEHEGTAAEYRLALVDARVVAVPSDVAESTFPYLLRSPADVLEENGLLTNAPEPSAADKPLVGPKRGFWRR